MGPQNKKLAEKKKEAAEKKRQKKEEEKKDKVIGKRVEGSISDSDLSQN